MSDTLSKQVDEAVLEYVKATEYYNQLLDKYFPVRRVIPGVAITPGAVITELVLNELGKAESKVTETRQKWDKVLRDYIERKTNK